MSFHFTSVGGGEGDLRQVQKVVDARRDWSIVELFSVLKSAERTRVSMIRGELLIGICLSDIRDQQVLVRRRIEFEKEKPASPGAFAVSTSREEL
jgi:hypothetical protein